MTTPATSTAPTLERLRGQLLGHGFTELVPDTLDDVAAAGTGMLIVLPLDDPAQRPEFFDLTVVLPEIVHQFGPDAFRVAFACPPDSAATAKRFGVLRHPALIFLREGRYVGSIEGLRDWADYVQSFARLRTEAPQPIPIPLSVSGARS
ncbi:hydrogenase [Paraburkholderia dinghuensis]|uniref:Hydrogenase n=1 Tax=Paraburkholderia dinghuensis TaxID=2305225 RepID=A0A3N6Q3X1_9BURK|nr:hydrogenase [Paraburkholderia dinghuensis]RQH07066.1 hydrogenase [Paraburkholderia dinghuensis]